jgi:hypothetical protein
VAMDRGSAAESPREQVAEAEVAHGVSFSV